MRARAYIRAHANINQKDTLFFKSKTPPRSVCTEIADGMLHTSLVTHVHACTRILIHIRARVRVCVCTLLRHSIPMQAKQSDGNRLEQILIGMAEGNHPLSQFSWGNNISLPITTPEQAALLQKNVRTFFESYYSSNLMTVCVSYVFLR